MTAPAGDRLPDRYQCALLRLTGEAANLRRLGFQASTAAARDLITEILTDQYRAEQPGGPADAADWAAARAADLYAHPPLPWNSPRLHIEAPTTTDARQAEARYERLLTITADRVAAIEDQAARNDWPVLGRLAVLDALLYEVLVGDAALTDRHDSSIRYLIASRRKALLLTRARRAATTRSRKGHPT